MRDFVNSVQSPEERRNKYKMLIDKGATAPQARRCRDWSMSQIKRRIIPLLEKNAT